MLKLLCPGTLICNMLNQSLMGTILWLISKCFSGMITTLQVKKEAMEHATHHDFSNDTELADYLATKGIPFREAHEIVGELVLKGLKTRTNLVDIPLDEYKKISPKIEEDVYTYLQPKVAVERRNSYGELVLIRFVNKLEMLRRF